MILTNGKLFKTITFTILITILLITNSFATVEPQKIFYVNDYADIIDIELENYIIEKNIKLNEKTGAQIVVVTVKNLEGMPLEEYATELFRKFGIGDKNKNNGVLLLLALEERQFRIEVGYGLEGTLTDGKTGRIQDEYIIPYLKNNDWNNGIRNGFNAILQEVYAEYNIDSPQLAEPISKNNIDSDMAGIFIVMIICGIIGFILRYLLGRAYYRQLLMISAIYLLILGILELTKVMEGIFLLGIMSSLAAIGIGSGGGSSSGRGGSSSGGRWRILWRRRLIRWWTEVQEAFR